MIAELAHGYNPHAYQKRLHASGCRFVCAAAGVRGGKTYAATVEFCSRIYRDLAAGKARTVQGTGKRRRPGLHYWLVAPTAALLREPWRYIFEILPPQLIEKYYESESALWLRGGILIEGKTADNPLHLVATGLDGLMIDEAARVKADAWRGQLRQRLSDRRGWAVFASTPLGRNWLYEDLVTRSNSDPEYETISWTTADNPIIARSEIEAAKRQLPKRYFEREYLASFDAFLGNVFDEFNEQVHVISEKELQLRYGGNTSGLFRRVVAGVDWGWNSPGCIIVAGDLGNGKIVVLDESYASHRIVYDPNSQSTWVSEARRLIEKWNVSEFFCDPADPGARFDFTRAGIAANRADNELMFGIRRLSETMHIPMDGVPRLQILDRCKNLIREIKNYLWDEQKGSDVFREQPAPNQSDHAIDACRYAVVELARWYAGAEDKEVSYYGR